MSTYKPNIRSISCQNCGASREENLRESCPSCGSRQYFLLGYTYQHEARAISLFMALAILILLIALVSGLIYLNYLITRFSDTAAWPIQWLNFWKLAI